jgi:hypothetical protein
MVVLLRIVAFQSACGPAAGQEGGACENQGGCNAYCDDGLQCDYTSNKCVKAASTPNTYDDLTCPALLATSSCAPGLTMTCSDEKTPNPAWNGACVSGAQDALGHTIFCCDFSKPSCVATTSDCPGTFVAYLCHDLPGPPGLGFSCAYGGSADGGDEYCCVEEGCFSPPATIPTTDCPTGESESFCGPSAAPPASAGTCVAIAPEEAPASNAAPAFCCTPADAGASDASVDDANDSSMAVDAWDAGNAPDVSDASRSD